MEEFEIVCDSYLQWLRNSMLFENVKRTRRPASNITLSSNYNVTRNNIKYVIYVGVTFKNNSATSSMRIVESESKKVIFKEKLNLTSTWNALLQYYKNVTCNVFQY